MQVKQDQLEEMVKQDPLEHMEKLVGQATVVQQELVVNQDIQVQLVYKEKLGLLEHKEKLGLLGKWASFIKLTPTPLRIHRITKKRPWYTIKTWWRLSFLALIFNE